MKKLIYIVTLLMLSTMRLLAEGEVLGNAQGATTETGTLIGTLMFIAVVAVWMLPLVFGVMVYSAQKKKAEQQHDDVGIKTAISSLVAIIIGGAAAYYIVGSIGILALGGADGTTLKEGNKYFLGPLFQAGEKNIK